MSNETEPIYLWWVNKEHSRCYFAGVAFREEDFGEYRLKIDCYPERKLYLKEYQTSDEGILFRVEENKKIQGFNKRFSVGDAYFPNDADEIEIVIAPDFSARLILKFKKPRRLRCLKLQE